MAKKGITNKEKKQLKAAITIGVVLMLAVISVVVYFITPPTLEKVLSKTSFDTSEAKVELTISNKNEEMNFTYIVSKERSYIKTIKEQDGITTTNVLFQQDSKYYLMQNDISIELLKNDAENMFNKLHEEVLTLEDYLEINYSVVKYYDYDKELIKFSYYDNSIFFDTTLKINDNKLSSLTQTYAVDNVINTVKLDVSYQFELEIPAVNS